MRNMNEGKNEKLERIYSQKEGDIFLKHNDTSRSTAIIIRDSQVVAHTSGGNIGISINSNGDIFLQGRPVFSSSGLGIVKNDMLSPLTENPLSFMASTWATPIPGYLRKPPDIGIFSGVKDILDSFLKEFLK